MTVNNNSFEKTTQNVKDKWIESINEVSKLVNAEDNPEFDLIGTVLNEYNHQESSLPID